MEKNSEKATMPNDRFWEYELEAALIEVRNDLKTGRFIEESVEDHIQRITHLSKWQLQRIEITQKELAEGNYLTNAQADKMIDEWLKA